MVTLRHLMVCAVVGLVGSTARAQVEGFPPVSTPHETSPSQQHAGLALLHDANHSEEDPFNEQTTDRVMVRVYDVADLLVWAMPYAAQHESDLSRERRTMFDGAVPSGLGFGAISGGMMGGLGGSSGGMGGAGGGFFSVPAQIRIPQPSVLQQAGAAAPPHDTPPQATLTVRSVSPQDELIRLITEVVAPDTWDDVGGHGSITGIGQTLVISQTESVHDQVAVLLQQLRQTRSGQRIVTLHAFWLWQPDEQVAQLLTPAAGVPRGVVPPELFREWRATEAPEGVRHYLASLTCHNGQTVHIQAGKQSLQVTGMTPIVGSEPGYAPQVAVVQEGAVLQVTPCCTASDNQVTLDLQSRVTLLCPSEPTVRQAEPGDVPMQTATALDRPVLLMQRLATTTRLALNQITLIGGMSFAEKAEARNLYLYVLVTLPE